MPSASLVSKIRDIRKINIATKSRNKHKDLHKNDLIRFALKVELIPDVSGPKVRVLSLVLIEILDPKFIYATSMQLLSKQYLTLKDYCYLFYVFEQCSSRLQLVVHNYVSY